jgi:hypothetical protein
MKLMILTTMVLMTLTGCGNDYVCELPKVVQYPPGKIVTIRYLDEQARIISGYDYFSSGAAFKCEIENNPKYTIRFKDGVEITVRHKELVI